MTRLVLTVFAIGLLLLSAQFGFSEKKREMPDNSGLSEVLTEPKWQPGDIAPKVDTRSSILVDEAQTEMTRLSLFSPHKNKLSQVPCIPIEEYNESIEMELVAEWLEDELGLQDSHPYYSLLSKEELLSYANAGDSNAMMALGMGYLQNYYSKHVNSQSLEQTGKVKDANEYSHNAIENSRYWFNQAAVRGKLFALGFVAETYKQEVEALQKKKVNKDKESALAVSEYAYLNLFLSLIPEQVSKDFRRIEKLKAELQTKVEIEQGRLLQLYHQQRLEIGLSPTPDIELPEEYVMLREMEKRLCPL